MKIKLKREIKKKIWEEMYKNSRAAMFWGRIRKYMKSRSTNCFFLFQIWFYIKNNFKMYKVNIHITTGWSSISNFTDNYFGDFHWLYWLPKENCLNWMKHSHQNSQRNLILKSFSRSYEFIPRGWLRTFMVSEGFCCTH